MLYKQVGFAASLAQKESYEIPVYLEDGWTSIHLTIQHSGRETGKVRASFDSEAYGRVDASFALKESGVDGFIVSDSRSGVDNLKSIDDKIREEFSHINLNTANLAFVFSKTAGNEKYMPESDATEVSDGRLYRIAKAFITAIQKA